MTRTIPGRLDISAMARLHFNVLDQRQQAEAIQRLAATGMSTQGIARATGLAVEAVCRVLEGAK